MKKCARCQQLISPTKDLLTTLMKYKMNWYGHNSQSSGVAKTILQGTVAYLTNKNKVGGKEEMGRHHQMIWAEFYIISESPLDHEGWINIVMKASRATYKLNNNNNNVAFGISKDD
jgi:hypothetical protein